MAISIDTSAAGFFVWLDGDLWIETDRPEDNDVIELLRGMVQRGYLPLEAVEVTVDGDKLNRVEFLGVEARP